jgi:bifunctional non-homologous end joining protein LigD
MMNPIIPFEPIRTTIIPIGENWLHQIKWDGVRILTYCDGNNAQLFNRKLNKRTENYPELLDIKSYTDASSVIFDGEVIALASDGKPSFHEVMRRDGIRHMENVLQQQKVVPITYMIFDILYYNGNWVNILPFIERNDILSNIVKPNEHVQIVRSFPDGGELYKVMQQQSMEGIVSKDVSRTYIIDGKDDRWRKIKNYGDIIAVIGGFTLSGGIVNSVLLGLYDLKGKFWYIGHTGTGKLSKSEWRELTEKLMPLVIKDRPFHNKPERHADTIWVRPELTAKVKYTEWRWKEGRLLRQPSIQGFVDIQSEECIFPVQ